MPDEFPPFLPRPGKTIQLDLYVITLSVCTAGFRLTWSSACVYFAIVLSFQSLVKQLIKSRFVIEKGNWQPTRCLFSIVDGVVGVHCVSSLLL